MQRANCRNLKKNKNRPGKICVTLMVMALMLILTVQISNLYKKNETYKAQQKQLEAQLDKEKQRSSDLKEKQAYVGSDQYVEDAAKSKLGMAYDNEIIFKEK